MLYNLNFMEFKSVAAVIGGLLGALIGGMDGCVYALIVFIVIDYITGVMCAISEKKLSSEVGAHGIMKKVVMIMMVSVGNIIDLYIIKEGSAIRSMVAFFYLANEGISILENAARLGIPVPKKLRDLLSQLKDKNDEGTPTE